jgi:hypothetical protein
VGETVAAGAAGGLSEHLIAAGALQGVDLELGLLVGGGDTGIAKQVSHAGSVAEPCGRVGCATLISDTGSGHVEGPWPGGCGSCRKNERFWTATTRESTLGARPRGEYGKMG